MIMTYTRPNKKFPKKITVGPLELGGKEGAQERNSKWRWRTTRRKSTFTTGK